MAITAVGRPQRIATMRLANARPPTVFISYRREDTRADAGRLYDALRRRWGDGKVRMDLEDIRPGVEFSQAVHDLIAGSDVLLVVIGTRWLERGNAERLADPADLVRREIEAALEKKVRVIPVLVGGASMPGPDVLPPSLLPLLERNAFELSDRRWTYDTGVLASTMERRSWLWVWLLAAVLLIVLAIAGVRALRDLETTAVRDSKRPNSLSSPASRPDGKSTSRLETRVAPDSSQPDSLLPPAPLPDAHSTSTALAETMEAVRLEPENAELQAALSALLQTAGRTEEARHAMARAVALDSANAGYRNQLGVLLRDAGLLYEAMQEFRAAIRLDPRSALFRFNHGELLGWSNQVDSAVAQLQAAIRLAPAEALYQNGLGRVLRRDRPAEALDAFLQAVRLAPGQARFHYDLGMLYVEAGRHADALATLSTATQLDPDNREYADQLRALARRQPAAPQPGTSVRP